MKKTKIFTLSFLTFLMLLFTLRGSVSYCAPQASQQFYEIKIYRIKDAGQAAVVDKYLKDAFIPAMHRKGITRIGVFKPVEADTAYGKLIYVFVPYETAEQYFKVAADLENDKPYQTAGKDFLDAPYNNPPFIRYESVFMKAFTHMPQYKVYSYSTPPGERIYELRSYESATEAKALKKIDMFNEGGEIAIFEKIGSNPVFWGQVLFGSLKPRLMYLTTYADMKSHDEHWQAFRNSPEWKTLSSMEEYRNTTSRTNAYLCHPTEYSDF
jgi:hypothetical protein